MNNIKYVIPCRAGSKEFPGKNRKLLSYTINSIPKNQYDNLFFTTDDEIIINECLKCGVHQQNILKRNLELALDITSTKETMLNAVQEFKFDKNDIIVMLYLTYYLRTWQDITNIINFYQQNNAKSLLCKKEIKTSPFLMMYELENHKGKQVIQHDLYRRQDYPKCFEISHFVSIFEVQELENLNNNLYNENTIFYPISKWTIDVDSQEDFKQEERILYE